MISFKKIIFIFIEVGDGNGLAYRVKEIFETFFSLDIQSADSMS